MLEKIGNTRIPVLLNFAAYSLTSSLILGMIYSYLLKLNMQFVWPLSLLALYVIVVVFSKVMNRKFSSTLFGLASLCALILVAVYIKCNSFNNIVDANFETILFIVVSITLINVVLEKALEEKKERLQRLKNKERKLFNLFYVNLSKVHEIAMLIDNKIMKTVEREQISEEFLKYNGSIGMKNGVETGHTREENSKKRVYENFDVKTTKSIMLRKLYETIKDNKKEKEDFKLGKIVLFENIELKQRNIDDTVMILNILQDSNIKGDPDDELELNLNKMMERMLDDFTIDYEFKDKNNEYIIQLPYKDTDSFENGYHHHDLQLGKLSIIGIYRGCIDFSEKDSTSSKFLELTMKEQNNTSKKMSSEMKSSNNTIQQNENPFKFEYKKLEGQLHLIDTIAIIQELNIDEED